MSTAPLAGPEAQKEPGLSQPRVSTVDVLSALTYCGAAGCCCVHPAGPGTLQTPQSRVLLLLQPRRTGPSEGNLGRWERSSGHAPLNAHPVPHGPLEALCQSWLLNQPDVCAFDLPENTRTPTPPGPRERSVSAPEAGSRAHPQLAPPAQRGLVCRSPEAAGRCAECFMLHHLITHGPCMGRLWVRIVP